MKILLTNHMADELLYNEDQIKNQIGAYRPHFNPVTKTYDPVIKCWPLEDFKGQFNQERGVIPGMENEVYNIALAAIKDNVFINFDLETNSVNISFSDKITTIFSHWSKEKVQWIIDDIHNELEEFFVHQHWNSITREEIYYRIFTILDQVYCYGNK